MWLFEKIDPGGGRNNGSANSAAN